MAREHAKDGLVVISLTVDPKEDKGNALKFLQDQKATFLNLWLDEDDATKEKWEKDFQNGAPPIVHVYDRSGKRAKIFDGDFKEKEFDDFIAKLLKDK
jgi:hypothetical protein